MQVIIQLYHHNHKLLNIELNHVQIKKIYCENRIYVSLNNTKNSREDNCPNEGAIYFYNLYFI